MIVRLGRAPAIAVCITATLMLAGIDTPRTLGQGAPGGREANDPQGQTATARATATVDLTGYWVSLVTEDWHWRMTIPEPGDVSSIPFTNDEEKRAILEAWDPAVDAAEGNPCRAYGAAAIMRVPTRIFLSWQNENVLKLETDAGMQTRLFRFAEEAKTAPGERSRQGFSVAEWDPAPGGGRGGRGRPAPPGRATRDGDPPAGPPAPDAGGSLKVSTTNLLGGYLRKNGVPYSEQTVVTEYFHRTEEDYGNTYLIVTTIVEDPEYLTSPFITSSHFRKLPDTDNGWNPTPCSVL